MFRSISLCMPVFRRIRAAIVLLALIGLLPAPAALADCASAERPAAGQNNRWHCENASSAVVVFVHGLHSDSRESWHFEAGDGGANSYWPEIVRTDSRLAGPSIYLGGFPTRLDSSDFGIREAADLFMDALRSDPGGGSAPLDKETIIFVAHSLGGIIVRDVLVRHRELFRGKRIGLLLIASPSFGSRDADTLAPAMKLSGHRMGEQLQWGSDYLRTLDEDFSNLLRLSDGLSSLVGRELYEQFPLTSASFGRFLPATAARLLASSVSRPVVERESAVRYFLPGVMIFGSDHLSIAKPDGPAHRSHGQLIEVFEALKTKPRPGCSAPPHFKVELDVLTAPDAAIVPKMQDLIDTPLPLLTFRRLDGDRRPLRGVEKAFAVRNPASSFHELSPEEPFPCPGEPFRAVFQRNPDTASLQSGNAPPRTELCFQRSRVAPDKRTALLRCLEGGECEIDAAQPGMAESCARQGFLPFGISPFGISPFGLSPFGLSPFGLSIVTTAHAQSRLPPLDSAATAGSHWSVPSLEAMAALPAEQRSGFTEFSLRAEPIAGLEAARSLSYGVHVNGVPIHFDDWPQHLDTVSYDPQTGFQFAFGIGNLGFTGGDDGLEKLAVELRFYDAGGSELRRLVLRRDYVSYRHARELALDGGGGTILWRGWYRPAARTDRAEVMLAVATSLEDIRASKALIDGSGVKYQGLPLIGVIRPPREDNKKAYGLVMGVQQSDGQVRSTFPLEETKAVCRWILGRTGKRPFPAWVAKGAYLYEFTTKTITEQSDRGKYLDLCSKLG